MENIQFLCLCFSGLWHNQQFWKIFAESVIWKIQWQNCKKATLGHKILVTSLYFLKYGNLHTKFPFEFSLCHYPQKHRHRNWMFSWKSTEFWHFLEWTHVMSSVWMQPVLGHRICASQYTQFQIQIQFQFEFGLQNVPACQQTS